MLLHTNLCNRSSVFHTRPWCQSVLRPCVSASPPVPVSVITVDTLVLIHAFIHPFFHVADVHTDLLSGLALLTHHLILDSYSLGNKRAPNQIVQVKKYGCQTVLGNTGAKKPSPPTCSHFQSSSHFTKLFINLLRKL